MGTRHLICVVENDVYKVAQYGQWDGYPDGQGAHIIEFLCKHYNEPVFRDHLSRIKHLTDDEVKAKWVEAGADLKNEWVGMDVAARFKQDNAHLSRDCGAGILDYIQTTENPEVQMTLEFASDSLFCEWLYVVDITNARLEVYKGFNKQPVPAGERFAAFPRDKNARGEDSDYYPVRHFATIAFSDLSAKTVKALVKKNHADASSVGENLGAQMTGLVTEVEAKAKPAKKPVGVAVVVAGAKKPTKKVAKPAAKPGKRK